MSLQRLERCTFDASNAYVRDVTPTDNRVSAHS